MDNVTRIAVPQPIACDGNYCNSVDWKNNRVHKCAYFCERDNAPACYAFAKDGSDKNERAEFLISGESVRSVRTAKCMGAEIVAKAKLTTKLVETQESILRGGSR